MDPRDGQRSWPTKCISGCLGRYSFTYKDAVKSWLCPGCGKHYKTSHFKIRILKEEKDYVIRGGDIGKTDKSTGR